MFRVLGAAVAALSITGMAEAATISFSLTTTNGSDSSDTDVVLTDFAGGVSMMFTVNDPNNNADIAAVYFDLGGDGAFTSLVGPDVTAIVANTSNVQAGNIGQTFDWGLAIGNTGSGSDFYDSFAFDIFGANLDISDFFGQTFAVRGQSVGPGSIFGNTGNGSSKEFGVAGSIPDGPSPVPLPAGIALLLTGLGALGAARLKRT